MVNINSLERDGLRQAELCPRHTMQETKAKMVWPCLKVFWFSKDNPTGHSERKKKKRQTEEEVGRQYQRVDRNGLCQLN